MFSERQLINYFTGKSYHVQTQGVYIIISFYANSLVQKTYFNNVKCSVYSDDHAQKDFINPSRIFVIEGESLKPVAENAAKPAVKLKLEKRIRR
jgi:hypothetical protein